MLEQRTALPRDRLLKLVSQILGKNSITRPVSIDDELTQTGLSSIEMVNLMLAVAPSIPTSIPRSLSEAMSAPP